MKKIAPVIVILLLIVLVAIAGATTFLIQRNTPTDERMEGASYFGMTDESQVAVMVDGTISETFGTKSESRYYIDYETVTGLINKRFYWDTTNNKILYTLPNEVVEMNVNDGNSVLIDGQLYISVEVLAQYTDMYYELYEAPNRVVIRTLFPSLTFISTTSFGSV